MDALLGVEISPVADYPTTAVPILFDVRAVRVTLPNDMLARGVTLVDTPGLHDASPAVRDVWSLSFIPMSPP